MKALLKWVAIILGGLLGLVLIISLILYGIGLARLNRIYTITPRMVKIPADEKSLREGKRIFQYRGCEACHGEELQGVNLTSGEGGIGAERTDLDLVRAVKYGVDSDGKALLFMPSTEFYYLSDLDLGRALAYIRSIPAVDNQPQPSELSATGFIVMNLTQEITFRGRDPWLPARVARSRQPDTRPRQPASNLGRRGIY